MILNVIGQTFGTLRIVGLAGRGPKHEPIWIAVCIKCGTKNIKIPHRRLQQGNAVCPASIHAGTRANGQSAILSEEG
jgi:hypothetical protein